jgi:acyl transferase domain-containing protein/acyl carrier protein
VVTESKDALREKLSEFASGRWVADASYNCLNKVAAPKVAFLFTGAGSQYVGMGRQLYETQPSFRKALERCNDIVKPLLKKNLLEILYPSGGETSRIDRTLYTHTSIFALEYALAELWKSWGIIPNAVTGHSVGEYAAACIAGVFSLEDGIKLTAERARLIESLTERGEMAVVLGSADLVVQSIQPFADEVTLAGINGPETSLVSGTRLGIKKLTAAIERKGIRTVKLNVTHALHSPLMEPMLPEFKKIAKKVRYSLPGIDIVSNVEGGLVKDEIANCEYWLRHLRQPVRFLEGMQTLHEKGCEIYVEIGPKPNLLEMGQQCLPANVGVWLPSLRSGQLDLRRLMQNERHGLEKLFSPLKNNFSDWQQMLESLGRLYVQGIPVDWSGFDRDYPRRKVVLPTYPFQRRRCWINDEKKCARSKIAQSDIEKNAVVGMLNNGDTEQLAKLVTAEESLSEKESILLPKLIKVLVRQHARDQAMASLNDWLYEIEWQPKPREERKAERRAKAGSETGTWLIFADRGGVGQNLAARLMENGYGCILVYPGNGYKKEENGQWTVNPSALSDCERLIEALSSPGTMVLQGVVHLWSLDASNSENVNVDALDKAQLLGCAMVIHLVQALTNHTALPILRLWLVTRGAVPAGPVHAPLEVAQSSLWGLGKAVSLEHPDLWGGMIDLSPDVQPDEVAQLMLELQDPQNEEQIAFRREKRYAARLVRSRPGKTGKVLLRPDGTYLISGGLGALGLRVAQWIVKQGGRRLVLIGRRGASEKAQMVIDQLEHNGAIIVVEKADVSNEKEMVSVFKKIALSGSKLRGIIHAAGISGYQHLKDMALDEFLHVLKPKVAGGWLLHKLTLKMELDFFVCFSSLASVWGAAGEAHYGAANQFIDMLAHYRRANGLPGLSINFGPWSGGGMATPKAQKWLSQVGITLLSPEQAISALGYLLGTSRIQSTVTNVDWTTLKGLYQARKARLFLEKIETDAQKHIDPPFAPRQTDLLRQLEEATSCDRKDIMMTHLQNEVAGIMRLEPSQLPLVDQGFFSMGMDSLMALELIRRIENEMGCSLPATLIFEYPNIEAVAKFIIAEIMNPDGSEILENNTMIEKKDLNKIQIDSIEQLSEDEVLNAIAQELIEFENISNIHSDE